MFFPKGIFPRAASQVATSPRLGLLRRCNAEPSAAARTGKRQRSSDITDLGSCHLGNSTFGKFPHGKILLTS